MLHRLSINFIKSISEWIKYHDFSRIRRNYNREKRLNNFSNQVVHWVNFLFCLDYTLTLKRLVGGRGGGPKSHLSRKCHWIPWSRSEEMKNLSVDITYLHWVSQICWTFWHVVVTKKLTTSAYNRWCQHFHTFNILSIDFLKIV